MSKMVYDKNSIEILKKASDIIRKKTTNFIPDLDIEGLEHIIFEVVDNGIDEGINCEKDKPVLTLILNKKTDKNYEITVTDNGRGIPIERAEELCTVMYSSGKYSNDDEKKRSHQNTGGVNGMGMKLITYLSYYVIINIYRDGKHLYLKYVDGALSEKKLKKYSGKQEGTSITFELSPKYIPGCIKLNPENIQFQFKMKSYIFPKIKFNYILIENDKEVKNKTYYNKDISDLFLKYKTDIPGIRITGEEKVDVIGNDLREAKTIKVPIDIIFSLDPRCIDNDVDYNNTTYCNTIHTSKGGKHLKGLQEGLVKYFNKNISQYLKKNEQDLNITAKDITTAVCSVIWVGTNKPEFRAQHKDTANNDEFRIAISRLVYNTMENDVPKPVIEKMAKIIKKIAMSKEIIKGSSVKKVENAFSKDKIDKYIPILWNSKTTHPELLIGEGDSIGKQILQGRDLNNQAIYSVTGKISNIYNKNIRNVLKLQTAFNDFIDIIGCGIGKNFDISKIRFTKIIFMTDADIDGDDIFISFLALIHKFARPLLEYGFIYRNTPPLYKFVENGSRKYTASKDDFYKYIINKFCKKHTLIRNGRIMYYSVIVSLININLEYAERIDNLSNKYECEPYFIEKIIYLLANGLEKKSVQEQIKVFKKTFKEERLLNFDEENGILVISGDMESGSYVFIPLNSDFYKRINKLKKSMLTSLYVYNYEIDKVTNLTLYDFMKTFDKSLPIDIQRYKGAGELVAEELVRLCLNPELRTLKRYRCKKTKKEEELFNMIKSNTTVYQEARRDNIYSIDLDSLTIDT